MGVGLEHVVGFCSEGECSGGQGIELWPESGQNLELLCKQWRRVLRQRIQSAVGSELVTQV